MLKRRIVEKIKIKLYKLIKMHILSIINMIKCTILFYFKYDIILQQRENARGFLTPQV